MKGHLLSLLLAAFVITLPAYTQAKTKLQNDDKCKLPPDTGTCGSAGTVRRWYFDTETGNCVAFRWRFCGLQSNIFRSRSICERNCKTSRANDESSTRNAKTREASRLSRKSSTTQVPTTIELTSTSAASTEQTTAAVTCAPIDCSQLSCAGSVVPRFDAETGCPTCECIIPASTEAVDEMTTTTTAAATASSDATTQEMVTCPPLDCTSASGEESQCADDKRVIDPESGCKTCQCLNESIDLQGDGVTDTEASSDEEQCKMCSESCRTTYGTARDESTGCDVTACKCVAVAPQSLTASLCADVPLDCTCSVGEVTASAVDENGCYTCRCVAEDTKAEPTSSPIDEILRGDGDDDDEQSTTEMPTTAQCPDVAASCETEQCPFGYEVDEMTGCETCECRHPPAADEQSNDYDGLLVRNASPQLPLCSPEVGCDVERCIRATEPLSECDLCLCDDDPVYPETDDQSNQFSPWNGDNGDEDDDSERRPVVEDEIKPVWMERQGAEGGQQTSSYEDRETRLDEYEGRTPVVEDEIKPVWMERQGSESAAADCDSEGGCVTTPQRDDNSLNPALVDARRIWCSLPPEHGPCNAKLTRWYHDKASGSCVHFSYGGCRGNTNNFRSEQACRQYCEPEISAAKNERREWYQRILGSSS